MTATLNTASNYRTVGLTWQANELGIGLRPVHTRSRNRRLCIRKQATLLPFLATKSPVSGYKFAVSEFWQWSHRKRQQNRVFPDAMFSVSGTNVNRPLGARRKQFSVTAILTQKVVTTLPSHTSTPICTKILLLIAVYFIFFKSLIILTYTGYIFQSCNLYHYYTYNYVMLYIVAVGT